MLGDNIRNIRKSKKMSINKLSKLSGISLGYLSDLENNNAKNPTMDKLQAIAGVLEVPLSELLTTEEKLYLATDSLNKINELCKEGLEEFHINEKDAINKIDITVKDNGIENIAAHFEGENFAKDDLEDIENFIKFILSKKKK